MSYHDPTTDPIPNRRRTGDFSAYVDRPAARMLPDSVLSDRAIPRYPRPPRTYTIADIEAMRRLVDAERRLADARRRQPGYPHPTDPRWANGWQQGDPPRGRPPWLLIVSMLALFAVAATLIIGAVTAR